MINTSIKNAVHQNTETMQFNTKEEKIFCSCVIYKTMVSFLNSSQSLKTNINTTIKSYSKQLVDRIKSYRNNYVCYSLMESEVRKINKSSFINYDENEINKVYKNYLVKTQVIPFDSNYFHRYMYNLYSIGYKDTEKMENIHKNIMVPIYKYFEKNFDIKHSDIEIYSAELVPTKPGKKIKFKIKGVYPAMIRSLIYNKSIDIKIYDCDIDGDYFIITTY